MNISDKLIQILTKLENAANYEDWNMVNSCIDELHFLYEEIESSFTSDEYDDY
jgi:hypothetical protein